ncbi:hypothetical protein L227DRAFT_348964 [Lentinus tigrinus ALCF2SS1-6]|uniref:Uncharacterized protein n=1 Tax=Lentinus tigrinus ALCF2SS1-6 TaxID=1328759 RepID=A0A5C2RTJ2_9APHY|nr:hypothetical protein L227DRAFT_348964 [Lentinus tigrinus ALCF2SS1-6]
MMHSCGLLLTQARQLSTHPVTLSFGMGKSGPGAHAPMSPKPAADLEMTGHTGRFYACISDGEEETRFAPRCGADGARLILVRGRTSCFV